MSKQIIIDGYDLTTYVQSFPIIEFRLPDWGYINLINDIVEISFIKSVDSFFDGRKIETESTVLYKVDEKVIFDGKVDSINYIEYNVIITCKSISSILFNTELEEFPVDFPYVADETYPAKIVKELLTLVGLTMNEESYQRALSYHTQLSVKFNVTSGTKAENRNLLEDVAKKTLARIYFYNNEFYYEPYDSNFKPAPIPIEERYWLYTPELNKGPGYTSRYKGTAIKYGTGSILPSLITPQDENPTETIDISSSSAIYTNSILIAQYLQDQYDSLGGKTKIMLNGIFKKSIGNLLDTLSYIKLSYGNQYLDVNFNIMKIKDDNPLGTEIESIALI